MKYKIGEKVIVTLYETEGLIVAIFNQRKKIYKVQIEHHIIIIEEKNLNPVK